MSLLNDLKFTLLISPRFEKFQRKNDYLFNVRCPLCGDSKKNKSKMRGFIFKKGTRMLYHCHNCGASMSIGNLIKSLDATLYHEYTLENYKSGQSNNTSAIKNTVTITPPKFGKVEKQHYENAERCDKLPENHFCLQYLKSRKIPEKHYDKLYYCDNFKKLCEEVRPNHDKVITPDKRLVIPFYDEYNDLIAVSGRALEQSDYKLRYVTLRTNDSENKLIYGYDRLKKSEKTLLVEGPIDSLFLNNCLASGDANLSLTAKSINLNNLVLIFDCEPRNKEIVSMMGRAIDDGCNVVIWPDTMLGKDINEFVMNGLLPNEIEDIISNNTFSGIQAKLKFNMWKKI
jgi:transcription elongation factor Elf1